MPRLSKIGAAALAAFGWTGLQSVTASYLVVAGGGGGGTNNSAGDGGCGGGGAGGYRTGTEALNPTQSYSVIVGAGGASGAPDAAGSNGSSSVFLTTTSAGGGGGGDSQNGVKRAGDGGSGGGAGYINSAAGSGNTPSTSPSQGNNGGSYSSGDHGAGGGGATAAGSNTAGSPGAGGAGTANSISGSSVTYAGGGGGGGYNTTGASGGSGGGGQGGSNGAAGISGTANLGGGGGGGGGGSSPPTVGGNGGSGVVIISYPGTQQFGGGVVTSVGGNTIHTFTTSGTLSPLSQLSASYLIVAGGGGGGSNITTNSGGGGGAGGLLSGSSLTIDTNSIYAVTVGAGGAGSSSGGTPGTNGSSSNFGLVSTTAVGGGGGGDGASNANGVSGGSGGGGGSGSSSSSGASGTSGQGNAGGNGAYSAPGYPGGGGGGASAAGGNATGTTGGNGGAGTASSISGSSVTYAGGGGGGAGSGAGTSAGTGGAGGGGNGAVNSTPQNGTANLGGGGGGVGYGGAGSINGGSGGSGIVIISYAGSTPQMAGGTVTVAGGNVIHTFTSSGYLSPITNLNNSLRFRSSASASLSRTPTSTGNRRTFTFSAWVKFGTIGTTNRVLTSCVLDGNNRYQIQISDATADQLTFQARLSSTEYKYWTSSAVFRDPSAWYHIVFAIDTTQATGSDRIKVYVNGVQQSGSNPTTITQNTDTFFNYTVQQNIGNVVSAAYFDGYMAEINFVDGQALTPNSFGAFNGQGVWQPVRYGGSYGTNGFYLPFTGSSNSTFAGSFNGSNQFLSVVQNAAFSFSTGDFTVETWVYANSWNSVNPIIALGDGSVGGGSPVYSGWVMRYDNSSDGLIWYRNDNTIGETSLRSYATLSATRWNHIAISRSSGILRMFINGIQVYSAANTTNYDAVNSNTLKIGGNWVIGGGVITWVNGYISNTRIVKGTGLYTGNFTPSTSALTNISGTSLLTLQNSTIIDNSSNAFTITNNNTVTTSTQYPFVVTAFTDQSPNGNNWTPNNIGGLNGASYDFMRDVPTNTSATAANYCVLNSLNQISASVSSANLNLARLSPPGWADITGTISVSSGKWYWESTMISGLGGTENAHVGILKDGFSLPGIGGYNAGSYAYIDNGNKITNSSSSAYGASFTNGDVIGVALDLDAGTLVFYKNGVSQGTAFSSLSGSFFPEFSGSSTPVQAANFGQRPFAYTPPTGFVALNTFNLPTPTIGATPATTANKYMDVNLWTGTGSAQSIVNSGAFQTDLVWVKARSAAYDNQLTDSVRGASKELQSNGTSAETTFGTVTSFNSNGFSVGTGASSNQNGITYVGWQWRAANGNNVTNTAGSITSTVSANTTAGFSIVTYTGNGTVSTVGHGLGVAPNFIIIKCRSNATNWFVGGSNIATAGNGTWSSVMEGLNTTSAVNTGATAVFNSTAPTSSVVTLGTEANANGNGRTFVMYCWAEVAGYSAFGSYTGNGSSDGTFVYTGFRPRFVMYKNASYAGTSWAMLDSSRNTYNVLNARLFADGSDAENTATTPMDFTSNGFKVRSTNDGVNRNGDTIIYMAFAESPFKYANAR